MSNRKSAIKEYDNMLQRHIEKKHVVKLLRSFKKGEANIFGYLLNISKELLLMQVEYDFVVDGYAIMPKYAFDSLRFNKYDKTLTKILVAEGIRDRDWGIKHDIDITGWHEAFTCLQQLDLHVVVECENKINSKFLIGPIARVGKNSVSIQYYDASGLLDTKPTTVKFDDITTVKFEDMYSRVFRKYLRASKTKK